jgi:hypothetical protein
VAVFDNEDQYSLRQTRGGIVTSPISSDPTLQNSDGNVATSTARQKLRESAIIIATIRLLASNRHNSLMPQKAGSILYTGDFNETRIGKRTLLDQLQDARDTSPRSLLRARVWKNIKAFETYYLQSRPRESVIVHCHELLFEEEFRGPQAVQTSRCEPSSSIKLETDVSVENSIALFKHHDERR